MLTTKLIFTSVVFLLNIILVYTHEYNSVCNQLCGGTSIDRSSPSSSSTTQGLPGKRGPKGQKGDSSTYEENEEQNRKFAGKLESLQKQISSVQEKLSASQKEVGELKELITQITDQLNNTLLEKMNDLKTELTDLNGAVEDIKESVTFSGRTCKDLLQKGYSSNGVYIITAGGSPIKTFCDMDAGGYIVFQRRFDGSTDFDQTFQSYSNGFGDLQGEYWLGLENMHQLTKNGRYQLRVDLQAYDNEEAYALYDDFSIGSGPGYQLNIGTYTGTAGDSLTYHNHMDFSTKDRDVDPDSRNCAMQYQGAWWFQSCHQSNLNALIYNSKSRYQGMTWRHFKGYDKMMKSTKMMFREM